jgi:hypothetical protein
MKIAWFRLSVYLVLVVTFGGVLMIAQQPAPSAVAPVPPQLLNAKTVFISNAGADSGLFPHPFTGDPDRAYNEFHAGVVSWGRYELVATPAEAACDLRQADALCAVGADGVDYAGGPAEGP